jgi:glutamate dehydrogenase/leucine dehydrogenase
VRTFAHLLARYKDIYLPEPDVGTNDSDMGIIAIESGLDCAVSKPVEMGGNRIDQLGAAAGGVVIALDELLKEMPRLARLPQCISLQIPRPDQVTVLIQGFGAVGAHAARFLCEWLPGARVTGISVTRLDTCTARMAAHDRSLQQVAGKRTGGESLLPAAAGFCRARPAQGEVL